VSIEPCAPPLQPRWQPWTSSRINWLDFQPG